MASVQSILAPLPSVLVPVQLDRNVARRRNSYSQNDFEPRPAPTLDYHSSDNVFLIFETSKSQYGDYRFYPLPGHPDAADSQIATRSRRASITFGKPSSQQATIPVKDTIIDGIHTILSLKSNQARMPPRRAVATNVPDQCLDRGCRGDENSACGAFMWAMAKEFTQYIIDARRDEKEVSVEKDLPDGFRERWDWDSMATRKTIRRIIDREKRVRRYFNSGDDEWFAWRTRLVRAGEGEDWTWDPYTTGVGF